MQQLEEERARLQAQLGKVNNAITALSGRGQKRNLSEAALARIRAAQKARWAKWRKAQRRAK
jgi:hypothetical protein